MAKRGEGDPRWIVEERSDSHNVNNWHWKECGMYTKYLTSNEDIRITGNSLYGLRCKQVERGSVKVVVWRDQNI